MGKARITFKISSKHENQQGEEIIKTLLEIDPEAHAILTSGYTDVPLMASYGEYRFCGMIKKPYRPPEMLLIVNKTIRENRKRS